MRLNRNYKNNQTKKQNNVSISSSTPNQESNKEKLAALEDEQMEYLKEMKQEDEDDEEQEIEDQNTNVFSEELQETWKEERKMQSYLEEIKNVLGASHNHRLSAREERQEEYKKMQEVWAEKEELLYREDMKGVQNDGKSDRS